MKSVERSAVTVGKPTKLLRREFLKNITGIPATGMAASAERAASLNEARRSAGGTPTYKRVDVPIEEQINDLLGRMTTAEKARQLDIYRGCDYVDKHRDHTHCAPDALFDVSKARKDWGELGRVNTI